MILASVICPVRGMGGKLNLVRKWIEEISHNPQIEIILVHDIADTLTGEELMEISNTYRNTRVTEGYFGNPGSARNAGLEICLGKSGVFWDSDDEPNVENFLASLDLMYQFQSDLVIANYAVCDEITLLRRESNPWSNELGRDFQTLALNPGIWRIIFSRELLSDIRFNPLRMAEDQIFLCEALIKARNVRFMDIMNYTYFSGSSQHLTRDSRALQDLLPAFKQTKELLKTNDRKELITFLNTVAARQLISGLRYGNQRTRARFLISLLDTRLFQLDFLMGLMNVFQNSHKGLVNAQ